MHLWCLSVVTLGEWIVVAVGAVELLSRRQVLGDEVTVEGKQIQEGEARQRAEDAQRCAAHQQTRRHSRILLQLRVDRGG